MSRYRTGLSGATTAERDALVRAQELATRMALQHEVAILCSQSPIGMAECTHLRVLKARCDWFRKGGKLNCKFRVWVAPSQRLITYLWRVPVPFRVPDSRYIRLKWGLKDRET